MTADIVAFLRERLDEDEQVARKAASLCGCHPPALSWRFGDETTDGRILIEDDPHRETDASPSRLHKRWNGSYANLFTAQHIARHDPARVLREVEAKRAILGRHQHHRFTEPLDANSKFEEDHRAAFDEPPRYVGCVACSYDYRYEEVYPSWWCEHVRLLAAPYSDHPDYRQEEWAP